MTPRSAALSAALLALSACAPQGVGFTGIGSEPAGVSAAIRAEEQPAYVPAAGAGLPATAGRQLPLHQAGGAAGDEAALAQAAMAAGGNSESTAAVVMLGTQGVMASLVDAGGTRFLVARTPRTSRKSAFIEGTGRAFLASVQSLTNCGTGQHLYRDGTDGTQAAALAVALVCD